MGLMRVCHLLLPEQNQVFRGTFLKQSGLEPGIIELRNSLTHVAMPPSSICHHIPLTLKPPTPSYTKYSQDVVKLLQNISRWEEVIFAGVFAITGEGTRMGRGYTGDASRAVRPTPVPWTFGASFLTRDREWKARTT